MMMNANMTKTKLKLIICAIVIVACLLAAHSVLSGAATWYYAGCMCLVVMGCLRIIYVNICDEYFAEPKSSLEKVFEDFPKNSKLSQNIKRMEKHFGAKHWTKGNVPGKYDCSPFKVIVEKSQKNDANLLSVSKHEIAVVPALYNEQTGEWLTGRKFGDFKPITDKILGFQSHIADFPEDTKMFHTALEQKPEEYPVDDLAKAIGTIPDDEVTVEDEAWYKGAIPNPNLSGMYIVILNKKMPEDFSLSEDEDNVEYALARYTGHTWFAMSLKGNETILDPSDIIASKSAKPFE